MALSVCGLPGPARRAYEWLRATQRADGSWPRRAAPGGAVNEAAGESNHAAYVAVGVWHEYLVTGDADFVARMWPTVRRAIEFTPSACKPRGGRSSGSATRPRCPGRLCAADRVRQHVPEPALRGGPGRLHLAEPQPEWELAAGRLAHAVACHPEAFEDKSRFSMDWYYPVLGGAVRGADAAAWLAAGWRLRGAGPRRPLRPRRALGHRRRNLRACAGPGRDRGYPPRTGDVRRGAVPARPRRRHTGPAGSSPTSSTFRTSAAVTPRRRSSSPPTRCPRPPGETAYSVPARRRHGRRAGPGSCGCASAAARPAALHSLVIIGFDPPQVRHFHVQVILCIHAMNRVP